MRACATVSHDPTLKHLLTLADGRTLTAVQLQMEYLDLAKKYVEDRLGSDADAQTIDVLARWESVLDRLETDPMLCARELDWVAKLQAAQPVPRPRRPGLGRRQAAPRSTCSTPTSARTRGSTTGWSGSAGSTGCSPTRRSPRRCTSRPTDTRAYFRGRCLEKYSDQIAAASWDSVIFDLPGRESLQRVPTIDPLRGSKAHVGELLDRCDTAEALVRGPDSLVTR